jgi:glycosyltransferase involved in cell wall biosynthesis
VVARVVACQVGARHSYAIPSAFAETGTLERFYTDICGAVGFGRLASGLSKLGGSRLKSVASLACRKPPLSVTRRTTTFDMLALRYRQQMSHLSGVEALRTHEAFFARFGEAITAKGGMQGATHFYSVMHEAGPALAAAKAAGLTVGVDVCIAPSWPTLLEREHDNNPDWGDPRALFNKAFGDAFRPYELMFDNADLFVCPSTFVQDDLTSNHGVPASKTALVPYGTPDSWLALEPNTEIGRILFAGTAEVRKGIHHFAKAAALLSKQSGLYKFIVAGEASPHIRNHPDATALTFLGRIPRTAIANEFSRADVFVLPSIAEGSAGVTYEAMSAGLPQVVSQAAGSGVRQGVDGIILPEPSPETIAEAVERIVGDRSLRDEMARSARERAHLFSWNNFGTNLRTAFLR